MSHGSGCGRPTPPRTGLAQKRIPELHSLTDCIATQSHQLAVPVPAHAPASRPPPSGGSSTCGARCYPRTPTTMKPLQSSAYMPVFGQPSCATSTRCVALKEADCLPMHVGNMTRNMRGSTPRLTALLLKTMAAQPRSKQKGARAAGLRALYASHAHAKGPPQLRSPTQYRHAKPWRYLWLGVRPTQGRPMLTTSYYRPRNDAHYMPNNRATQRMCEDW